MKINVKQLRPILDDLRKVADCTVRGAGSVLSYARATVDDGAVELVATDYDVVYRSVLACETEPGESWIACVPVAKLADTIKGTKGAVDLAYAADTRTLTVLGRATALLSCFDVDDYPRIDAGMPAEARKAALRPVAGELLAALTAVAPCMGKEEARMNLNGAFLSPDGNVVTTDGHRMCVYPLPILKDWGAGPTIMRRAGVPLALRLLDRCPERDTVLLGADNDYVFLATPGVDIRVRRIDEDFPPYAEVIPDYEHSPCMSLPQFSTLAALAAVKPGVDPATNAIILSSDGQRCTLTARSPDGTCADAEIDGAVVPEGPVNIMISHRYLTDAIRAVPSTYATLSLTGDERPHPVWCDWGDSRIVSVVMPIGGGGGGYEYADGTGTGTAESEPDAAPEVDPSPPEMEVCLWSPQYDHATPVYIHERQPGLVSEYLPCDRAGGGVYFEHILEDDEAIGDDTLLWYAAEIASMAESAHNAPTSAASPDPIPVPANRERPSTGENRATTAQETPTSRKRKPARKDRHSWRIERDADGRACFVRQTKTGDRREVLPDWGVSLFEGANGTGRPIASAIRTLEWIGGCMDATRPGPDGAQRWRGTLPGWSYTRLAALCELQGGDLRDWTVGPFRLCLKEGVTYAKRDGAGG